jgi:membrane protease YdiL (CAAX protease family)
MRAFLWLFVIGYLPTYVSIIYWSFNPETTTVVAYLLIIVTLVCPIATMGLAQSLKKISWAHLGLCSIREDYYRTSGAKLFIFSLPLVAFLLYGLFTWIARFMFSNNAFEMNLVIQDATSPTIQILLTLVSSIHSGVLEEVYFRGLFRMVLSSSPAYVLVSSSLFAMLHWHQGIQILVSTFLLGVFYCLIYLKVGSILPLIASHVFNNLVIDVANIVTEFDLFG